MVTIGQKQEEVNINYVLVTILSWQALMCECCLRVVSQIHILLNVATSGICHNF